MLLVSAPFVISLRSAILSCAYPSVFMAVFLANKGLYKTGEQWRCLDILKAAVFRPSSALRQVRSDRVASSRHAPCTGADV